ncbi:MAG: 50S ribosomal protein L22 [Marinilabiliales bacterium]|nr:MAG: 50S ribosomal protein L22 [Marinilabiliales bacterium]
MGARKRNRAEALKEERKQKYYAVLRNCPTSPRKMRLVADLIRGENVNRALDILKYTNKEAAQRMEKLVMSAISNWQQKNEGVRIEDSNLIVKDVYVDSARILKRLRPAPQGRAYRIRKRSNHVTVILGDLNKNITEELGLDTDNQE